LLVVFTTHYKRCPADKVLVISGRVGKGSPAKLISGGAAFVIPFLQEHAWLDLTPLSLDIDLKDALSLENIRVAVPTTVTIAVSRIPDQQMNAATRLLDLTDGQIIALAQDVIFGQMRQVIAAMSIEEINRNRDAFLKKIEDSLEPELAKFGLIPLNVNIKDIKDASGYIEATGRKAAAQAVQQANADVADQEKAGKIRVAEANQEEQIRVAEARRTTDIGVQSAVTDKEIQVAEFARKQAVEVATRKAEAAVGESVAAVRIAEARQKAETAKAEAEAGIEQARNLAQAEAAKANSLRIEAEKRAELEAVAKAEAAKTVVDAQAKAQQVILAAEAEGKAIYAKLKAEADGQLAIANAKAEGIKNMVAAAGGAELAYKLLMVDHMDHIADASAEAIKNIRFDKVMVWSTGEGGEIPNFLKGLAKTVPPLADTIEQLTGIRVPGMSQNDS
jgi:flotillin